MEEGQFSTRTVEGKWIYQWHVLSPGSSSFRPLPLSLDICPCSKGTGLCNQPPVKTQRHSPLRKAVYLLTVCPDLLQLHPFVRALISPPGLETHSSLSARHHTQSLSQLSAFA